MLSRAKTEPVSARYGKLQTNFMTYSVVKNLMLMVMPQVRRIGSKSIYEVVGVLKPENSKRHSQVHLFFSKYKIHFFHFDLSNWRLQWSKQ